MPAEFGTERIRRICRFFHANCPFASWKDLDAQSILRRLQQFRAKNIPPQAGTQPRRYPKRTSNWSYFHQTFINSRIIFYLCPSLTNEDSHQEPDQNLPARRQQTRKIPPLPGGRRPALETPSITPGPARALKRGRPPPADPPGSGRRPYHPLSARTTPSAGRSLHESPRVASPCRLAGGR